MIKIGNAQGFWGDRTGAAARLLAQQPDLDYLTMDYLAEVSLSILAIQRETHPALGYALDFVKEMKSLVPYWNKGSRVKVVANAGGLNPLGCAKAVAEAVSETLHGGAGRTLKIGVVSGDDVLVLLQKGDDFPNLDTGDMIQSVQEKLVSANAYLGADPIAVALSRGADIVITGRVADPSLVVGCCLAHFGWKNNDYQRLAAATIAGHLIECGTQVTGGISTNWLEVPNPGAMGFPVVEVDESSDFVVTKGNGTGGVVNLETVKEQLLYEIGDPGCYLSPDVTVSILGLKLELVGKDRVRVSGALGRAPSDFYKVSATFRDGFMSEGMITLFGRHVAEKGRRCGEMVLQRVAEQGYELERAVVECLGAGDVVHGVVPEAPEWALRECVLRVCVADHRKEAVDCFTKEIAPLVTSGSQGTTGYAQGRPRVRQIFGFWPCLIEKSLVNPEVRLLDGCSFSCIPK